MTEDDLFPKPQVTNVDFRDSSLFNCLNGGSCETQKTLKFNK